MLCVPMGHDPHFWRTTSGTKSNVLGTAGTRSTTQKVVPYTRPSLRPLDFVPDVAKPLMSRHMKRTKYTREDDVVDLTHSADEDEDEHDGEDEGEDEDEEDKYAQVLDVAEEEFDARYTEFRRRVEDMVLEEMSEDWDPETASKIRMKIIGARRTLRTEVSQVLHDKFQDWEYDDAICKVLEGLFAYIVFPTQVCAVCKSQGELCYKCASDPDVDCAYCPDSMRACPSCRCKKCGGASFACLERCA